MGGPHERASHPFQRPEVRAILEGRKTQTRRVAKVKPWRRSISEGSVCWKQSWATVWDNGTWHTWDENGVGGENSVEESVEAAKREAFESAMRQGFIPCPFGQPGDRLFVRESLDNDGNGSWMYSADGEWLKMDYPEGWIDKQAHKPSIHSIHMPRWACRIVLEITGVQVERLQDIDSLDAKAEGLKAITKDGSLIKWGIPDRDGLPGEDDDGWHWRKWQADPRKAFADLWESINGKGSWEENPWVRALTFKQVEGKR